MDKDTVPQTLDSMQASVRNSIYLLANVPVTTKQHSTMATPPGCCASSTATQSLETRAGKATPSQKDNGGPAQTVTEAASMGCQDDCCAGDHQYGGIEPVGTATDPCSNACCRVEDEDSPDEAVSSKTTCCLDEQLAEGPSLQSGHPRPSCEDPCCAEKQPDVKESQDPECCAGKSSPCCDTSCLDRLAARECLQSDICNGEHLPCHS